jgi:hypothetical protein
LTASKAESAVIPSAKSMNIPGEMQGSTILGSAQVWSSVLISIYQMKKLDRGEVRPSLT